MIKKLNNLLESTVTGLGFEFVDLEITPSRTIAVYIDKENGVTIEDCESVSKHLNQVLFVEEIDYNRLEVSSPGLERPLKKIKDFIKFIDKKVKIKTMDLVNNQKVFHGFIKQVDGDNISLELEDKSNVIIKFDNIYRAKLVFEIIKKNQPRKK